MFAGMFVLALILVWTLVKVITTPLVAVVNQAQAISRGKFDVIKVIPKTPELRSFVLALNHMSASLADIFNRLSKQSERYRDFAYTDNLTKLGNRRAFDLAFEHILTDTEHHSHGFLMIIRLSSLTHVNRHISFDDGDCYIKTMSELIVKLTSSQDIPITCYKLNGADFAVVVEECNECQCIDLASSLIKAFDNIEMPEYRFGTAHVGMSAYHCLEKSRRILEMADSALSNACEHKDKWQLASRLSVHKTNSEWREHLHHLVVKGTNDFARQGIVNQSGEHLYNEWFARFKEPNTSHYFPMSQLIPASIHVNYTQQLDRVVIKNALNAVSVETTPVGINLSRQSLTDESFQQWLLKRLIQHHQVCSKLVLELPERALMGNENHVINFVQSLKELGVKITIERFGAQFGSVSYLQKVKPHYLKIDGRFTRNIHIEKDNQLFLQSLINVAHGLHIEVIAEMVQTQEEANCLYELQIDYLQGYFIVKPEEPVINNV